LIITVTVIGLSLTWQLKIPEEKVHILEYAILGWFASRDLIKADRKLKGFIIVLFFTFMVGVFDELFQKILPYRFFQWSDIELNSLGGIWGISLFTLYRKREG
jgi:VanZ family protein